MSEDEVAEIIALVMIEHCISPHKIFTADAGMNYGWVEAWKLPSGGYAVQYGDDSQTDYEIAPDADDLAEWLLPQREDVDSESWIVSLANIRGLDAIDEAKPDNDNGYAVLVSRSYYGGMTAHNLASNNGEVLHYETIDEAKTATDKMDEEIYFTAYNEAGRPIYTVVAI